MTLEELAIQLGVSTKEAMALCHVAGVTPRGPTSKLSDREVRKVQAVLTGQAKMLGADELAGRAPLGERVGAKRGRGGLVIGVLILIAIVGLITFVSGAFRGPASIYVSAGDCFNASLFGGSVFGSSIERTDCSDARYRAFAVLELDPVFDSWPGRDAIEERATQRCLAIAPRSVQQEGQLSPTTIYYFGPADEGAWSSPSARKIVCATPN